LSEIAGDVSGIRAGYPLSLSLPSLRPDGLSELLARGLTKGRKSGITLAPEAGTDRMRRAINKKISMDETLVFLAELKKSGRRLVKLYFMIGLPGESRSDLDGIVSVIRQIKSVGSGAGKWEINITVSSFVPKPHTPFQWEPVDDPENIRAKQKYLRGLIGRIKGTKLSFHDIERSMLEAAIARGGPEMGDVILSAWKNGCRFDGWSETFRPDLWERSFKDCGYDVIKQATRKFDKPEYLPWDIVDAGVKKNYLVKENEKALRGEYTWDCLTAGCQGCGVCE
jgi:radical SAM superfamily enzyme YgiQ (UPF0313 family)